MIVYAQFFNTAVLYMNSLCMYVKKSSSAFGQMSMYGHGRDKFKCLWAYKGPYTIVQSCRDKHPWANKGPYVYR